MCTGRVDLAFVLRAFQRGADGVIIGGCWPGECHYVTEGNYDALGNMYLCKKLTKLSYPDIGKNFNNKHHSTVMYSVRQIEEQRHKDPPLDRQVQTFVDHFS